MLLVSSNAKAERTKSPLDRRNHGRPKSYVALLGESPRGTVERKFLKRSKSNNGSFYQFRAEPQPGDIYEIRRWQWDANRETFIGGTVYIGFDAHLECVTLTRDEAFYSVLHPNLEYEKGDHDVKAVYPERFLPSGVRVT